MCNLHLEEDEAARYLLEELTPIERRLFEARLEQSAELRSLVRQLEEGAVVLALASKQCQPPREVWDRIQKSLHRERPSIILLSIFRWRFWRTGWVAAAVCMVGWMLSSVSLFRPDADPGSAPPDLSQGGRHAPSTRVAAPSARVPEPSPPALANITAEQLLQARAREIGALHNEISALSNRLAYLSRTPLPGQGPSSAPGKLTFFQLTPASGANVPSSPLSTNLQHALFLAMARELGWLPPAATADARQNADASGAGSGSTNQPVVDFLDLRSSTAEGVAASTKPAETEPSATSSPGDLASASDVSVPGFVSGTNAFLAFDSSVVASGSSLSFWTTTASGQPQSLGATTLGDHVVVVAFSSGNLYGGQITVLAEGIDGSSSIFHLPTTNSVAPFPDF